MKTTITNIDGVKWGFETEMADPPPCHTPPVLTKLAFFVSETAYLNQKLYWYMSVKTGLLAGF